jgi:membrane-associated phospholipid phosphatase
VSPVEPVDKSTAKEPPATTTGRPGRRDRPRRDKQAAGEMVVGAALILIMVAGGFYFAYRPASGAVDRWFLDVLAGNNSGWFSTVTYLRYPMVIVVGAILAAAITYRRDRPRAFACLIGPPLALATCELVAKPLVGRTLGGVLSYPSGSTVGAAALAAAAVLATPARWHAVIIVVASLYALWMAVAVVALRWHYPTDALAGLAYGVGVVLVADGLAWKIADGARHRSDGRRPSAAAPAAGGRSPAPPLA